MTWRLDWTAEWIAEPIIDPGEYDEQGVRFLIDELMLGYRIDEVESEDEYDEYDEYDDFDEDYYD